MGVALDDPIDVLKIGRSFIAAMALGIERPEQLELLRAFGARLGQGFLFARPMHATAFRQLVGSAVCLAS